VRRRAHDHVDEGVARVERALMVPHFLAERHRRGLKTNKLSGQKVHAPYQLEREGRGGGGLWVRAEVRGYLSYQARIPRNLARLCANPDAVTSTDLYGNVHVEDFAVKVQVVDELVQQFLTDKN
jgi:hypothetical protein